MTYVRVEPSENGQWIIKPFYAFEYQTFKTKTQADKIAVYLNAAYAMGRESAWTDLRHLIGADQEGEVE